MPNYPVDEGAPTEQQCTFCFRRGESPGVVSLCTYPDPFAVMFCQPCKLLMRHYLSNDRMALERWFNSLYKLKVNDERK